jgi:ATP-dependent DNA helicase RecG
MPEQQNIKYKSSWHDDYLKWICGFVNAQGGFILIKMIVVALYGLTEEKDGVVKK